MGDSYSSFQSLLEEKAVTVLSADAQLATGSGVRIEVKTFEAGLRANPRDYKKVDLPCVVCHVQSTDPDEDESLDTVMESATLGIFVIVGHADFKTRRILATDIAARAKRVAREQTGSAAWDSLAASIPGGVSNTIETRVAGPVVDDLGQSAENSTSRVAVATVAADVTASIDDDVS